MTKIDPTKTLMFAEAREAADVVARQLDANAELIKDLAARLRTNRPRTVVTYARGSSDHAATFAKYVIETRVGVLTSSGAPSIASVYRDPPDFRETLALDHFAVGPKPGHSRRGRGCECRRGAVRRTRQRRAIASGGCCGRHRSASGRTRAERSSDQVLYREPGRSASPGRPVDRRRDAAATRCKRLPPN